MPLKPFRDYSEHDVLNLFKFVSAAGTGDAGIPVTISAGFNGSSTPSVASNLAAGMNNGNTYSPRWTITPAVIGATSGQIPLGITLYKTLENNQFNYSYLYDKQRKDEAEAVVSGEAVPILTKGVVSVYVGTGASPAPSPTAAKYVVTNGAGTIGASTSVTGSWGKWLGTVDAEGYAVMQFDCVAAK